jgi:hypothetical protein
VKLKYYGEEISFELIEYSDCHIACLIVDGEAEEEDNGAEEKFKELGEDEHGGRLEPEALFAASP